jgi:hypothetical protein
MPPSNRGPQVKHWCFTLNNYTEQDVERLSSPLAGVQYIVFGREVGASGTPHLQGYVCFRSRKRLQQVISVIGQAHCSATICIQQSIEYCKKDGDFIEVGVPPKGKGKRSDLEDLKNTIKEGVTDLKAIRELHSAVYARCPNFVHQYIEDNKPPVPVEAHPLRQWQSDLHTILNGEPDRRKIIFIVDVTGNQGKTWFCRYYESLHNNVQILTPGKKADMAYTVKTSTRVFFFDCPRSKQGEFIQYDFLEEVKNGYVFSSKYESTYKRFSTPHVVVVMNEQPAMDKLSSDRYQIINLV